MTLEITPKDDADGMGIELRYGERHYFVAVGWYDE